MLEIQNISYSYGRKKPKVLSDFSLTLDRGGIYGLLGPNGAGKSTLLYLCMGALMPQQGVVKYYDEASVRGMEGDGRESGNEKSRNSGRGVVTYRKEPRVMSQMMIVPEEIKLPAVKLTKFVECNAPFYPRFSREVMSHCLEVFEMNEDVQLHGLSMGQKKKVYLSFALACGTPVLLMDEPTNGLDISGKSAFRRLVAELMTDDRIMVISTHQVRDLDQLLDHVVIMDSSKVIFSHSVSEIQRHLLFARNVSREQVEGALCWQPAPGGVDIMAENQFETEESEINLELLFEFALHNKERLDTIFSGETV